ncbi:sporulation protein [Marinobacter salinus]|uniref:Sporulation protein n=1 Tax=Marinobacter salinus TaxID=1874317 RepID=A0A1D9GIW2_9GAMM|nr:SPOR domain-containing protein [Marinobacter salinus]AOY87582.1 sporulation protein [Marinobacter salinus]
MDGLKQRIIGALVLVSLAVIFVPMVFDEPHSERTSTDIKIPEEPPFPEVTAPDADSVTPPSYQEPASEIAGPDTSQPDTEAPAYRIIEGAGSPEQTADDSNVSPGQPAAETANITEETDAPDTSRDVADETGSESVEYSRSLEGAWVVQLGSFGNAENARRLRDQVREKGYGSHLQEVVRGDTTLNRVFCGPFASKSDAEAAKRALDQAFSLNSLVTTGDK